MFDKIAGKHKLCFSALMAGLMFWGITGHKPQNKLQNIIRLGFLRGNAANKTTQSSKISSLKIIKQRGYLICGVNGELPGFSFVNADDQYEGIDVDLCRAIAAALFDDPNKVKFRNLTAAKRWRVLSIKS